MAPDTAKLQFNPAAISLRDAARLLSKVGGQPVTKKMLQPNLDRLALQIGKPGCLILLGERAEQHRLYAEHLTAEYRVKTRAGAGPSMNGSSGRNGPPILGPTEWLAASIQVAVLAGTESKPRSRSV